CKACGHQTSVPGGTVLHGTRTPLPLWFWAAYLVATHTPGLSALQLQRQLGIARYETAWAILHKLRRAMVRPDREPLKDQVEVDETYIGGPDGGVRGGRQLPANQPGAGAGGLPGAAAGPRGARGGAGRGGPPPAWVRARGGRPRGAHRPRRLARLRLAGRARLPPPAPPSGTAAPRGEAAASHSPGLREPQGLARRDPPRRQPRPSPGLPRRVHLPLQPTPHPDGRLPTAPRAGHRSYAHVLPRVG